MSEKVYALLLRLFPSSFRKEYEGEALQLVRDRLRNETGLLRRARLWVDLAVDMFSGLPHAYRNSYAMTNAPALSPDSEGKPPFGLLEKTPLRPELIAVGSALTLIALLAFAFLMNHPVFGRSFSNGSRSPIETVMQRLNRPPAPDLRAKSNSRQSAAAPTTTTKAQIPSAAATGPPGPDLSQRDQRTEDRQTVAPPVAGNSKEFLAFRQDAIGQSQALSGVRTSQPEPTVVSGPRSEAASTTHIRTGRVLSAAAGIQFDAVERQHVVEAAAANLREYYFDRNIGQATADALLAHEQTATITPRQMEPHLRICSPRKCGRRATTCISSWNTAETRFLTVHRRKQPVI